MLSVFFECVVLKSYASCYPGIWTRTGKKDRKCEGKIIAKILSCCVCVCVFLKNNPNKQKFMLKPTNQTETHTMKYLKWTKIKIRIWLYFIESIMGYQLWELLRCHFLNASPLQLYCHSILFYGMFCELYDPSLIPASATLSNYCYLLHNSSMNSRFYSTFWR